MQTVPKYDSLTRQPLNLSAAAENYRMKADDAEAGIKRRGKEMNERNARMIGNWRWCARLADELIKDIGDVEIPTDRTLMDMARNPGLAPRRSDIGPAIVRAVEKIGRWIEK